MFAGATSFEEFHTHLKQLDIPLQSSVKDLRSQVVREACLTIAFLAKTLGLKFDRPAELLLNTLINLIQNSAKVIFNFDIYQIQVMELLVLFLDYSNCWFIMRKIHPPVYTLS